MSRILRLLSCLLIGGGALQAQEPDNALPSPLPASRYVALTAKSMFAPAASAATIAPPEAKPSFAADLFVAGLARFGGKDFVMIINRRTREKFSLLTGETGPDNIELAEVRWAADPAQSAVTVKRGTDSSVLAFDEAAFQKPDLPPAVAAPPIAPETFNIPGAPPVRIVRRLRGPRPQ